MISRDEILKGRDKEYPLTPQLEANLTELLARLNRLRALWNKPMIISSGYRPGHYNSDANGAPNSRHMSCQAADISDPDGSLTTYLFTDQKILNDFGFWMEHPQDTIGWCHLQICPPPSGLRIFRAKAPTPLS